MLYFYILILVSLLNAFQISENPKLKNAGLLDMKPDEKEISMSNPLVLFKNKDQNSKETAAREKSLLNVRALERKLKALDVSNLPESEEKPTKGENDHLYPVINALKTQGLNRRRMDRSDSDDSSSSEQLRFWMEEWDEYWLQKKYEALNSTQLRGDVVNMVAARPWGVNCGDPNQHDVPWGQCMLPAQCDGEYRIYRGDSFCGRTGYICCALQLVNYDMYQGLDLSMEGSSFSTEDDVDSKERARKRRLEEKRKRKRERITRKKRIMRSIRRIITEIRRILNRAYRNGTAQRKKKTRDLKMFIQLMKKKYRKDRKSVLNVHEQEVVKIDQDLQIRLDRIRGVNQDFMSNDTFRDIVVNGTVNRDKLLNFLRENPKMAKMFKNSRRMGDLDLNIGEKNIGHELEKRWPDLQDEGPELEKEGLNSEKERLQLDLENPKFHDYDVEFGVLYY